MTGRSRLVLVPVVVSLVVLAWAVSADAHPMSGQNASFVQTTEGAAVLPFLYLGAKHMVTGYDHLLFLLGVIFFLYRPKDVVQYVSLFTIGHSVTLLAGVLGGVRVNPYAIDTIIGLSVVYKAFENIGGFERVFGVKPDTRIAVLVFGLFHGLGLATKLQEFALSRQGLVINILSFNVGVEVGQVCALTGVLLALAYWRTRPAFLRHAFVTNIAIMTGGFLLAGYQAVGYLVSRSGSI
jgi:HupE / UreJ protein